MSHKPEPERALFQAGSTAAARHAQVADHGLPSLEINPLRAGYDPRRKNLREKSAFSFMNIR